MRNTQVYQASQPFRQDEPELASRLPGRWKLAHILPISRLKRRSGLGREPKPLLANPRRHCREL